MKQQRDFVTKRAPVSVLDLPGMERWLSDMAARGLFLERQANFSTQSFRFRRGTPRNGRRYRLCPAKYGDTAPSEELLELYADQGWQYVVCAGRGTICFHVFFHDDPAASEPFTDTDSLIYALRTPIRRGFATLLFSGYLLFHAITRLSWGWTVARSIAWKRLDSTSRSVSASSFCSWTAGSIWPHFCSSGAASGRKNNPHSPIPPLCSVLRRYWKPSLSPCFSLSCSPLDFPPYPPAPICR